MHLLLPIRIQHHYYGPIKQYSSRFIINATQIGLIDFSVAHVCDDVMFLTNVNHEFLCCHCVISSLGKKKPNNLNLW